MAAKKKRSRGVATNKKNASKVKRAPSVTAEERNTTPELKTSTRVLCIIELLELVFTEIPARDLLLLQRVCRKWRSTIANSKVLQQVLFLAPVGEPIQAYKDAGQIANAWWYADTSRMVRWATAEHSRSKAVVVQNPMLAYVFSARTMCRTAVNSKRRFQAFAYRRASWKRMLISQPPVVELYEKNHAFVAPIEREFFPAASLDVLNVLPDQYLYEYKVVRNQNGLKMADLMPEYAFGLDESRLKDLKIKMTMEDNSHWLRTFGQNLTARRLLFLLHQDMGLEKTGS